MKLLFKLILIFGFTGMASSQSIVTTKHNLSMYGPGTVKATSETEVCIFCHTAHNTNPLKPLWNRNDPGTSYTLYGSSTLKALPGQPNGSSMMCLSCHDGTIALGEVLSRGTLISFASTVNMPVGPSNLTTNLSNDHPISFAYDVALATLNPQLRNPGTVPSQIKMVNNQLECTSCHDPHVNNYTDFLRITSQNSSLCVACHDVTNWTTSSHNTSTHVWNAVAPNPWPYSTWTTVAQNACENCHNSHNAGSATRLLKYQTEESNCLDCHNGNAASKNIQADFAKTYRHNVYGYTAVHDPTEAAIPATAHVECSDCHNPHMAKAQAATAPAVSGPLLGVKGVNQSGVAVSSATNEYEICYRCHSSSAVVPAPTPRVIAQNDVSLEFALTNPSFHPVVGQGVNTNGPSLITPLTVTSKIYCTSCHSSSGAGAPNGPHGSIYPHILKLNYKTTDGTSYSATDFDLCYSCHNPASITGDASFTEHNRHLGIGASCNTCHDPHGISGTQGTAANNSNLINFNTTYVLPVGGVISFTDTGLQHGTCVLVCHGRTHNPLSY